MALSQEEFRSHFAKRLEEMEAKFQERLERAVAEQKTALMAEFGGKASSLTGKEPQVGNSSPPVINIEDGVSRTAAEIENLELKKRLETLERSMTALKTHKELVDMDSLSLFPEARLPAKFKMPEMDKFDGTTCPKTHLRMYVGALQPFGLGDELLAQLFQQSLTGAAMRWFVGLDKTKIRTWEDVCHAFNSQYHYNLEVDVTRRELETTRQEEKESFAKFLTRWRKKTDQMTDRPTEQEQVDIIIKNLRPVYQTQLL